MDINLMITIGGTIATIAGVWTALNVKLTKTSVKADQAEKDLDAYKITMEKELTEMKSDTAHKFNEHKRAHDRLSERLDAMDANMRAILQGISRLEGFLQGRDGKN